MHPPVLDDAREQLISMLSSTARHVDILSPLLEPLLLDNEVVASKLTQLARRGRTTRIRMILAEERPVLETGHQLVSLSRRLPTAMSVKVLPQHSEWNGETLVVCDAKQGLLLKLDEHRWRQLDSAAEASREAERFERLWHAAEPAIELRQF